MGTLIYATVSAENVSPPPAFQKQDLHPVSFKDVFVSRQYSQKSFF